MVMLMTVLAISTPLTGCAGTSAQAETTQYANIDTELTQRDTDGSYDRSSSKIITLGSHISAEGAEVKDGTVTISDEGCYVINGKSSGTQIIVNAPEKKVQIVLEGVTIENESIAPVNITEADKVFITLAKGSSNILSTGSDTGEEDGVIFSRADLTINGEGALEIKTGYKHGIVSKDDLVIADGSISITAPDTGMEGKDCVKIGGGTIDITAGEDGIKSDSTEENRGYVYIKEGNINIVSGNDGIQCENVLLADGGSINIKTGEGSASENAKKNNAQAMPGMGFRGHNGTPPEGLDGSAVPKSFDGSASTVPPEGFGRGSMKNGRPDMPNGGLGRRPEGNMTPQTNEALSEITTENAGEAPSESTSEEQSDSKKALKSEKDIIIKGGTFTLDTEDDSVHSNGNISISGGNIEINSGDDAVHAEKNVEISSGNIAVKSSYEGIEGGSITVYDGSISVISSDDGINASSDTEAPESIAINIKGGNITVDAGGDGIDSNGSLNVEGGTVYVSGTEQSGNSAIDSEREAVVTGGTVIAAGSAGMAQGFAESSKQCSILHSFDSVINGGEEIALRDENGSIIAKFTPSKAYQSVVVTSPELKQGRTYTLSAGTQSAELTLDSVVTSNVAGRFGGGQGRNRMPRGEMPAENTAI